MRYDVPVSTEAAGPLADRLGYLLKHAREALSARTGPALAPYGIDGRALAVLTVLAAGGAPMSQQEAAARLGVDRTTMVGLVDALEARGLVERVAHPEDRRKNVVRPTAAGRDTYAAALAASDEAERAFTAPLGEADAARLRSYLRILLGLGGPPET